MNNLVSVKQVRCAIGDQLGLLLVLAGMVVLFSYLSKYFFTAETFMTIANDIPALAVMSVGMTFVLIIAGIDLSVGSVMALASAIAALAIQQWHWSLLLGMLFGIGTGFLCGFI